MSTNEKSTFFLRLRTSFEKITNKKAKTIAKHGDSYIRHYHLVGCDGVTFGPIGGNLHGDNEWVDIKSLEKYYLILKDFLFGV
ncbi:MAG: hypothetical protein QXO12_03255 [Candidatus Pacearchaeota archaeon]